MREPLWITILLIFMLRRWVLVMNATSKGFKNMSSPDWPLAIDLDLAWMGGNSACVGLKSAPAWLSHHTQ